MRVTELWRHPVKSMQGEPLEAAELDADGVVGDRLFGVKDLRTGKVLTAKREAALLLASARTRPDGEGPAITLPDGRADPDDDALSAWLGHPVALVAARDGNQEAEYFTDALDTTSEAIAWTMPDRKFVDAAPVLVLTTASLRAARALYPDGAWEPRRFRANVVVDVDEDGFVEDGWMGHAIRVGTAVLEPMQPCVRCTMVTRPQPGLGADLDIFRTLARHHDGNMGMWCSVHTPGTIRVGDAVTIA